MVPHTGDITFASTARENVSRDSGILRELGRFFPPILLAFDLLGGKTAASSHRGKRRRGC